MLCRIYVLQIQPRKHVLDHAFFTAPAWQHEVDHIDQESICPAGRIYVDHELICHICENLFNA